MARRRRERDPQQGRPPRAAKGNLLWYAMLMVGAIVLAIAWTGGEPQVTIKIGTLRELIQQGAPDRNPAAASRSRRASRARS